MSTHRIGIDLGTTNTAVAYTELGRERVVKVEKNEYTSGILPSCVAWGRNGLLIGSRAFREPGCVRQFKRELGTDRRYELGDQSLSPVELSSLVLRRIKDGFEREVGQVEGAVITVPANFTDRKRAETKEAGRLAGLDVLRIINEPSAAAIAYARSNRQPGENALVVDWGGGTLDVSLLDCMGDIVDIKSNDGDERCGGVDIDQGLMEVILADHAASLGGKVDLPAVRWEVERAAEQIKIHLSEDDIWDEPLNLRSARTFLDVRVDRNDLRRIAEPLVDRVLEAIDRCLAKAPEGRVAPNDVSEVILVGGSSKLPLLRRKIADKFGRDGRADINPMEVVALGAAYQAEHAERTGELVTVHSLTHALGTAVIGPDSSGVVRPNLFSPILEAGMRLPARGVNNYSTVHDNQESIDVRVFEALVPAETVDGMTEWGEGQAIVGLPKAPAGSYSVEITFEYSIEQELAVTVSVPGHGVERKWTAKHREELEAGRRASEARIDDLVSRTLEPLRDVVRKARMRESDLDRTAGVALADLEAALSTSDINRAKEAKARLMEALFDLGISLDG